MLGRFRYFHFFPGFDVLPAAVLHAVCFVFFAYVFPVVGVHPADDEFTDVLVEAAHYEDVEGLRGAWFGVGVVFFVVVGDPFALDVHHVHDSNLIWKSLLTLYSLFVR